MKIQILNAGHQILANLGEIVGLNTIDQCMQHDEISSFFEQVQRREIVPHVAAVPGMQPQDYVGLVASRFANPKIKDTVRRVAFDGAARHSGFYTPQFGRHCLVIQRLQGLLWLRQFGQECAMGYVKMVRP